MSGRYDLIDRARHWLIRKLACGDLIMLNFSMRDDGMIDKRNLGPALIADAVVTAPEGISAVSIGSRKKYGLLNFRMTNNARFKGVRMISPTHWGVVFNTRNQ